MARKSIEVFFSYHPKDEELRDELEKHLSGLKRQGVIKSWHDRQIQPGQERKDLISSHLNTADIILLLISSDFLASDYHDGVEVQRAMERHQAGEARVIPILLRPVEWQGMPFSNLEPLPQGDRPITKWENRDEAFADIARGISSTAEQLVADPKGESPQGRIPQPSVHNRTRQGWLREQSRSRVLMILGFSFLSALGIMAARMTGLFQDSELQAYDRMMRSRSANDLPDKRLVIINITDEDLSQGQYTDSSRHIISDATLNQLLNKLDTYHPKTIGLDLLRYPSSNPELRNRYQRPDDSLIVICKVRDETDPKDEGFSTPVPPEFKHRIGFSNPISYLNSEQKQQELIARRHLFRLSSENRKAPCFAEYSFAWQVATHFLGKPPVESVGEAEVPAINGVPFNPIETRAGGYQGIDARGYQMLLNYRAPGGSPQKIAETTTLTEFLNGKLSTEAQKRIKGGIVLIGSAVQGSSPKTEQHKDLWATPFSPGGEKDTPGVVLQAQALSQILNAVEQQDPEAALIWVLPYWSSSEQEVNRRLIVQWGDFLWVWVWSLGAGCLIGLVYPLRSPRFALVAVLILEGLLILSLWSICQWVFANRGWLPVVPTLWSIGLTSLITLGYTGLQAKISPSKVNSSLDSSTP